MDEALRQVLSAGAEAWPTLKASTGELEALVRERVEGSAPDELDAAEVYIAALCALGNSDALIGFEERYFGAIRPALASMSLSSDDIDEIKQRLRIRLFTSAGDGPPPILRYAGDGNLRALVRVSAVRAALSHVRDTKKRVQEDDWFDEHVPATTANPELAHLKDRHMGDFKRAFEDAARGLDSRDRSLLRFHAVHRLSIDEIGSIYGIHRATAARWVSKARDELVKAAQKSLTTKWQLRGDDLAGVLGLIESQVSLSLDRLLESVAVSRATAA